MAGLGDILSLGSNGLSAQQSRINVYSQNIANIDTEGYVRRDLELESSASADGLGTGVRTGDVTRSFNLLRNNTLLREEANAQYHSELADSLTELETLSSGTTNGLGSTLQEFEAAWQAVAANPEDLAARSVLLQKANTLAASFNAAATRIDQFKENIASTTDPMSGSSVDTVADINNTTLRLQELNKRIYKAEAAGRSAPDLCDERDRLVRDLAGNVNISVSPDYRVTLGGQQLVSADGSVRQAMSLSDAATFAVGGVDVSASISGGKLSALRDAYAMAATTGDQLDQLAGTVANQVNTIFNSAYNLNGTTPDAEGYTFFTGNTAATIAVDGALYDPANPMNCHPELIAAGAAAGAGDNTAAQAISDALEGESSALGGMSNLDFQLQMQTKLAAALSEEKALAEDSGKMVEMLDGQMQAEAGVNLDEEMLKLMGAQRAYEAAARVVSTANKLLDVLMNLR